MRGGHTTFALTAAGCVSLFSAGIYDGPQIEKGLSYLKREKIMQSDIIFIMAITMRFKPCGMLGEIGGMIGILVFEIS